MKNSSFLFVITCLSIAVGALGGYSVFLNYFGQGHELQAQIRQLENKFHQEQFKNNLLSYQLQDLQQTVAMILPQDKVQLAQLPPEAKGLSSALRRPASEQKIDLSGVIFEKGKAAFKERKFEDAIRLFKQVVTEFPVSAHVVESRFFIAESFYQRKDYKSCLSQIEEMIVLYPDHDLTGFAMLRMAAISEINNQLDEAREISNTVLRNFDNPKLVELAKEFTATEETL